MAASRLPHIVLFSGGSACRALNLALCALPVRLTRVVPAWDSGGSSKVIRESLDVLSVGDIRQALMTMAHGEGRAGDVVKICNVRLAAVSAADAREEFAFYAEGRHPLLERMEPGLRGAILTYLRTFRAAVGPDFDLRNGSVGNFILTGAHLAHGGEINTAIFVFRKLCDISGHVWPSSAMSGLDLSAALNDGRTIAGQHRITALSEADGAVGICSIALTDSGGGAARANEAVLESLADADVIVFGPGSFFTSILPHFLVDGIVPAITRNREARRVLIGNILQCRETRGLDLARMAEMAGSLWRAGGGGARPFTDILANRQLLPFGKTVGPFAYLPAGDLDATASALGAAVTTGEFEDAWNRGGHDGAAVAAALVSLLAVTG